jgi:predicted RNase H-like HicB family nuclease
MKRLAHPITFIVEKTDTGFSGYAEGLPIYTSGQTITELRQNGLEAAQLYYENETVDVLPDSIRLEMDFQQFFAYYRVINAKFLAKRIGMNETLLSQYVKGHKKPSEKQTNRILDGIREIGWELSGLDLKRRP